MRPVDVWNLSCGTPRMTPIVLCGQVDPPSRKDIELLRCDFRVRGFSLRSSKTLLSLSRDAVIARCSLGLRSGRLRGAVFHNARSLRCAQNVFAKHLEIGAEYLAVLLPGLRHSETVPALFPAQTPSLFLGECDHLRRPRCALGRSAPMLPRGKPDAPLRVRRSSRIRAHRREPSTAAKPIHFATRRIPICASELSPSRASATAPRRCFSIVSRKGRAPNRG